MSQGLNKSQFIWSCFCYLIVLVFFLPVEENQVIITFDYATGAICRADPFAKSQIESASLIDDKNSVVLYLTEAELDGLKKVQSEQRLYLTLEDLNSRLKPTLLMGHRSSWVQMLLSQNVAKFYRNQTSQAQNNFICCDCGSSFSHLHLLANHIQIIHVEPNLEDEVLPDTINENPGNFRQKLSKTQ